MTTTSGADLDAPTRDEINLVEVLQALADPVRLQVLRALDEADGEIACGELALPVTKSTRSHHFKVLREAGLIEGRIEGTRRYYTLRREDLDVKFPGLIDTVLRAESPS